MNVFKKIYCRTFQFFCHIAIPFLPYREPKLVKDYGELVGVLQSAGKSKPLIVTDKVLHGLGICDGLIGALESGAFGYALYDGTVANPTTDNVAEAVQAYRNNNCDCLIAIGGGSSMDCAKAVGACLVNPNKTLDRLKGLMKVRKRLPLLIAIPTTAGTGSETTVAAVITDSQTRHKYAINDFRLIPDCALLDSALTLGLLASVTAATGMDALTHAIEAFIGRSTTRETRRNALKAAKLIFSELPVAYSDGSNKTARSEMLYASYLAGLAFTKSYVGYVHSVAHALGGKYNVAHGLANAVILPHMLKRYGKSVEKKLWKMGVYVGLFDTKTSKADGAKIFIDKIEQLNASMKIPATLDCIVRDDVFELARTAEAEANPLYPVPKLFTAKQLEDIIREVGGLDDQQ